MPKSKANLLHDSNETQNKLSSSGNFDQTTIGIVEFNMINCPAGEFWMGPKSGWADWEKPRHKVKITKDFWMGESQVTQELWYSVMGWNPSLHQISEEEGLVNLPVDRVTWYDCVVFCNKLSALKGYQPCYVLSEVQKSNFLFFTSDHIKSASVRWKRNANGYRLPTEAEWEYAAKATREFRYSGSNHVDKVAWYDGNSGGNTCEVKTKKPNDWGLYDMTGNVNEWCHDMFDDDAYQNRSDIENPVIWQNKHCSRVVRGGSYNTIAEYCRVTKRIKSDAGCWFNGVGLRLSRSEP